MIIKCKYNQMSDIKNAEYLEYLTQYIHQSELSLNVGTTYTVYGIVFWDGFPWYYICEDETDEYPVPKFGGFFSIIDSQFSSLWKLSWLSDKFSSASLLPTEWAENRMFYENLIDGKDYEKIIFQNLKSLMDNEFS